MATWQFSVALLPNAWAVQNGPASLFTQEGWDTTAAWADFPATDELTEAIDALLPRAKSWADDLIIWGSEKSDDIQLSFDGSTIDSLAVRLDLREPNSCLMAGVINLCKEFGLAILDVQHRRLVEPGLPSLSRTALESRAAAYARDPAGFLSRLP